VEQLEEAIWQAEERDGDISAPTAEGYTGTYHRGVYLLARSCCRHLQLSTVAQTYVVMTPPSLHCGLDNAIMRLSSTSSLKPMCACATMPLPPPPPPPLPPPLPLPP
jgi:hypothetical protein